MADAVAAVSVLLDESTVVEAESAEEDVESGDDAESVELELESVEDAESEEVVVDPSDEEDVEVSEEDELPPDEDPLFDVSTVKVHFLTSSTAALPLLSVMGVNVMIHFSSIGPIGLVSRKVSYDQT